MIVSIYTEKASDRIQYVFMLTALNKVEIEGNYFHETKAIHEKLTANFTQW